MSTIDELIRRNSKYYDPSEIVGNITKSEFGPNTRKLIHVMSRDGFKCDCCGESNVVFTLHKHSTKDRYKFRPYVLKGKRLVRMTLDHNVLDCLQGGNDKENMTALCEDCNALRQHKFAEYSEFKHWYHNADRSIEPDVNYCFIEYIKNANKTSTQWAAYMSRIKACSLIAQDNIKVVDSLYFKTTDTMKSHWWRLKAKEKEAYLKIISGEEDS